VKKLQSTSYLALGDSLTEGIGASSSDKNFVSQYFSHIQRDTQCTLRNFGVSGMNSSELLTLVQNPAVLRFLPRTTHLSITTGGCDFIKVYEKHNFCAKQLLKTIKTIKGNAKKILETIRKYNPHAMVHLLGFYIPQQAYEYGVNKVSMLIQSMNQHYRELCQQFDIQLVDPYEVFLHRLDYLSDEVHPNQQGYDELAKLFIGTLK
jgi:lysophospholipase L1-like esterase